MKRGPFGAPRPLGAGPFVNYQGTGFPKEAQAAWERTIRNMVEIARQLATKEFSESLASNLRSIDIADAFIGADCSDLVDTLSSTDFHIHHTESQVLAHHDAAFPPHVDEPEWFDPDMTGWNHDRAQEVMNAVMLPYRQFQAAHAAEQDCLPEFVGEVNIVTEGGFDIEEFEDKQDYPLTYAEVNTEKTAREFIEAGLPPDSPLR